jgi:DNA-binding transcriptional MerR regulator
MEINILLGAGQIILLAGLVYIYIQIRQLKKVRDSFSEDNRPINLEDILGAMGGKIKQSENRLAEIEQQLTEVDAQLKTAYQKLGIVRFDALADEGGKLSFTLALLDENNSGIILTSIHGRQQSRSYTKVINNQHSEAELSEEEMLALKQAMNKTNN